MKKIFFTFILLFSSIVIYANNIDQDICDNNEIVCLFEDFSIAKYTCTIEMYDDDGFYVHRTATSDVSAMDACNKAMRSTQTNDALDD